VLIKAWVSTDNLGYEVSSKIEAPDAPTAVFAFIDEFKDRLVPGRTTFSIDGIRRYRLDRNSQLITTIPVQTYRI